MLKLSLVAKQGNGVRYFPHAGYLRLTPLKVEGIVRTRIDEDNKPLLCSDLYVALRCYEVRLGLGLGLGLTGGSSNAAACVGTGAKNGSGIGSGNPNPSPSPNMNVLFEVVVPLWKAASASEYELLGDGEWPFKIVVPPNASPVCSTVHFQEYRVFWRVETVLTHVPITGVGIRLAKIQEVPLLRYDTRQDLPPQPPNKWRRASLPSRSSKSPPSTMKYIINNPPFPFAPLDHVPVTLKLSLPPGIDVTSITLSIERRLVFKSSQSPTHNASCNGTDACTESTPNLEQLLLPPQSSSKTATTMIIASATVPVKSADRHRQSGHASYTVNITLQIPQAKSLSHWSLGETTHTPLASVRFFLKSKITIADSPSPPTDDAASRSPSPSSPYPQSSMHSKPQNPPHQYTLDLQEKELYVIATNEADRREAMSKYKDAVGRGRKRRVGKEKDAAAPPTTELESASATPLTSECDSRARGRSSSQPKRKSRFQKDKETSPGVERASHEKKGKEKALGRSLPPSSPGVELQLSKETVRRPNSSEGKTNVEITSDEINCLTSNLNGKSDIKSKGKRVNRTHGLTLGFLTPRSRRYLRRGRASDGDGNGDGYDEEYIFVNNEIPLSAPPVRRMSKRRSLVPPSSYPQSPVSPYETSADESSRVVYYLDGRKSKGDGVNTNISTGTTTTTTSEGTEEIFGLPTPPEEALLESLSLPKQDASQYSLNLQPRPPFPCRPPASLTSSRSWTALPFPDSLQQPVHMNGMKAETIMNDSSGKLKSQSKDSSTIAGIRFRRKSKKLNSGITCDESQTNLSPVSYTESDSCPTSSRLWPFSPVRIPFSPSTPDLPTTGTLTSTLPASPDSPTVKSKPNSKSRARTFGIGWGFGWS